MIPEHLFPFFWDIDCTRFQPERFPDYTILRLLELGDPPAVAWLRGIFSQEQITDAIRTNRCLSPRSAGFWSLVYGIPQDEVRVLRAGPRRRVPGWEGLVCPPET